MTDASLLELGTRLRAAGLTPRALSSWAGTDRIAALPGILPEGAETSLPAARALALFVAGVELAFDQVRTLPIDRLVDERLVARAGDRIRGRVAIVPLGPSLLVCDRFDASDATDLAAWPDDSSHHLATALPGGRRRRWLDLGCGSGFAQLARPELATELVGVDLNPRAVRFARLGAALSGVEHFTAIHRAAGELVGEQADLVTCNAPIPGALDKAIWRRANDEFFVQLWPVIRASLAPGGMAVVHAMRRAIPGDLPGERVIVSYSRGFAVLWWRPDGADREVTATRALTDQRPHVDVRDRDDALAATAC